jgi:hypothetical protein
VELLSRHSTHEFHDVETLSRPPLSRVPSSQTDVWACAQELGDALGRPVRIDCPNDADHSARSAVVCDVDNRAEPPREVVVRMREQGTFTWQVAQQ